MHLLKQQPHQNQKPEHFVRWCFTRKDFVSAEDLPSQPPKPTQPDSTQPEVIITRTSTEQPSTSSSTTTNPPPSQSNQLTITPIPDTFIIETPTATIELQTKPISTLTPPLFRRRLEFVSLQDVGGRTLLKLQEF